jgi:hypothetical protein
MTEQRCLTSAIALSPSNDEIAIVFVFPKGPVEAFKMSPLMVVKFDLRFHIAAAGISVWTAPNRFLITVPY